jgi:hypothetical protein
MTSSTVRRAVIAGALFLAPASSAAQSITFTEVEIGKPPEDFEPALTGNGSPGQWEVANDDTAQGGKALAQISRDPTDYRFPLLIYMPTVPADVEATIRFKPVSGKVDQAGGVAVRLADRNNYYIARANALENNVRLYRVVAGRREPVRRCEHQGRGRRMAHAHVTRTRQPLRRLL